MEVLARSWILFGEHQGAQIKPNASHGAESLQVTTAQVTFPKNLKTATLCAPAPPPVLAALGPRSSWRTCYLRCTSWATCLLLPREDIGQGQGCLGAL